MHRETTQSLLVFVFALLVSAVVKFTAGDALRTETIQDETHYLRLSAQLARDRTYGGPGDYAYRAPLYPIALAGVFRIFGPSAAAGEWFATFICSLLAAQTFLLGRRLAGVAAGLLAAAFLMVDSFWWHIQIRLFTEPLQGALICGAWLIAIVPRDGRYTWARALIAGCLIGASQLVKPNILPIIPLSIAWFVFVPREQRRRVLSHAAVAAIGAAAIMAPWWIRNYQIFDRFVPFTTGGGMMLYGSYSHENEFRGLWADPDKAELFQSMNVTDDELQKLTPEEYELFVDRTFREAAIRELKDRGLGELFVHEVFKLVRFWSPSAFFAADTPLLAGLKVLCIGVNSVIILGFFLAVLSNRLPGIRCASLLLAAATATALILVGWLRYRYPFVPIIVGYSAAFYATTEKLAFLRRKPF